VTADTLQTFRVEKSRTQGHSVT